MGKLFTGIVVVLLALTVIFAGIAAFKPEQKVVVPSASEIAAKVNTTSVDLTNLTADVAAIKLKVNENTTADKETLAKSTALVQLSDKTFKKELTNFLISQNESIESYKNITKIGAPIKTSVELDDNSATVTYTLRVDYFLEGDTDLVRAAKLTATFDVTDLDNSDIEADVSGFELVKFYDLN